MRNWTSATSYNVKLSSSFAMLFVAVLLMAVRVCANEIEGNSARGKSLLDEVRVAVDAQPSPDTEKLVRQLDNVKDDVLPLIRGELTHGSGKYHYLLAAFVSRVKPVDYNLLLDFLTPGQDRRVVAKVIPILADNIRPTKVSPQQIEVLLRAVSSDDAEISAKAATCLTRGQLAPWDQIMPPIVARFVKEIDVARPSRWVHVACYNPYVPPSVYFLSNFVRVFLFSGDKAFPYLREARDRTSDPRQRKWLLLALGKAGDSSVAEEIKGIVLQDEDRYVRHAAVDAYARCAGKDALPFLESLLSDTTETEFPEIPESRIVKYIIRDAAKHHITRIVRGIDGEYPEKAGECLAVR